MNIYRSEFIKLFKNDFLDALSTLEYSYNKLHLITLPNLQNKNIDELESWKVLTSRFARCTNIFLSKYLRYLILDLDPGFRGEMRDYLDKAEKNNLIESADKWMMIRELRNKIAHEYTKEDLLKTLNDVLNLTPFVLIELNKYKNK